MLFAHIDGNDNRVEPPRQFPWIADIIAMETAPPVGHPHRSTVRTRDIALILDLPAQTAVHASIALLAENFFPVPLFNALPHDTAVVPMQPVIDAITAGTTTREQASLSKNAMPAFLLDARRRGEGAALTPGRFDNRSVVFETDFPSAAPLLSAGVHRVVLVHEGKVATDLLGVLAEWQRAGIVIHSKRVDEMGLPAVIAVRPPSFVARLGRWFVRHTLRKGADGTFGALIERPHASG